MKTIIYQNRKNKRQFSKSNFISFVLFLFFSSSLLAQESFEAKAKAIALNIENISKEEKAVLKTQIEAVNIELEKNNITKQQADDKKMELATKSANNIENRVALEQEKLMVLVQAKVDGNLGNVDTTKVFGKTFSFSILDKEKKKKNKENASERRTTTQFVFAAGLNNAISNGEVANSDFRYFGSHFYEWGFTYNTRLAKDNNLAHFKYGLSFQYNNLRPTDNRIFQTLGNQTNLQKSIINLSDSRLRNVNIVIPFHFELDFSKTKILNDKKIFKSHEGFRLGLGGYFGLNVKTKQILEFDDVIGNSVSQHTKGNFNSNDFVYGLSSYLGYSQTSLYIKYDLNPIFANNPIKQNNISLGLRLDFN